MSTSNTRRGYFAFIASISVALVGCGGGGYGGGGDSPPPPPPPSTPAEPTVSVSAPAGSSVNRTVPLTASVDAATGVTITTVDFLIDGASVGTATQAPFTVEWDSSSVEDGEHTLEAEVTDDLNRTVTSEPVTIAVLNNPVIHVELAAIETFPPLESDATGAGDITFNLVTGAVTGGVALEGLTATLAHIHRGFAGSNGPVIVDFEADPSNPAQWNAVEGATLSADDIDNLLAGGLYVNVHTAANPAGEIRGQLRPENVNVVFSDMSNDQVAPPAPDAASGKVATTIDTAANTATVHALTSTLVEPQAAHVHLGAQGTSSDEIVMELAQAEADPNHWFAERQEVSAAQLEAFDANEWYVDVHTAGSPDGAVRGQIIADASLPPPSDAPTLSELQANVFTPICSGCHSGVGDTLPGVMNLTNANASFDSLVGVASIQQGSLQRVAPGDAENSYLVHKIEGAPTIDGGRMPLGGTPLDAETIAQIRAWIDAGAQNN